MNKFNYGYDIFTVFIDHNTNDVCINNTEHKYPDIDVLIKIKEFCELAINNQDEYIKAQREVNDFVNLENQRELDFMNSIERKKSDNIDNGYIYLILDKINDAYKIGYSKNPKGRLKQLQIATSNKLELLFTLECNKGFIESEIHHLFRNLRINSEWFKTDDSILDYFNIHQKY